MTQEIRAGNQYLFSHGGFENFSQDILQEIEGRESLGVFLDTVRNVADSDSSLLLVNGELKDDKPTPFRGVLKYLIFPEDEENDEWMEIVHFWKQRKRHNSLQEILTISRNVLIDEDGSVKQVNPPIATTTRSKTNLTVPTTTRTLEPYEFEEILEHLPDPGSGNKITPTQALKFLGEIDFGTAQEI